MTSSEMLRSFNIPEIIRILHNKYYLDIPHLNEYSIYCELKISKGIYLKCFFPRRSGHVDFFETKVVGILDLANKTHSKVDFKISHYFYQMDDSLKKILIKNIDLCIDNEERVG